MQVNETLNEGLKRSYSITVTAAELEAKVNEKLAEAQPEVEMKGFRKGKVPMALLKKQFGQRVMGEAMQESIDGAMSEHFEKSGDRPAMQPEVKMTNEDWKEGDDVEVAMSYEALPDIPEVDFSTVKLEKLVVKAGDAEVEEALGNLAETAQDFKARKKGSKAKDGDQVVMDFVGKVDGEAFDGGSAEDYPLVLGSNSFIPGFEEQLVGVKEGEEKAVTVSFPEDYQAENLKGKEAVFDCTIKEVKQPVAAEINDELAKKFGADDLAALKTQISERLEAEYSGAVRWTVWYLSICLRHWLMQKRVRSRISCGMRKTLMYRATITRKSNLQMSIKHWPNAVYGWGCCWLKLARRQRSKCPTVK